MNRISHFLRAKTQYNLHSPLVFRLYTEALFSRAPGRGRSFEDVVWRLEEYYGLPHSGNPQLVTPDGEMLVVDRPHRDEASWLALCNDSRYQVTIDLYSCGICIANPHLSRQNFILH